MLIRLQIFWGYVQAKWKKEYIHTYIHAYIHTNDSDCTIILYLKLGMKHIWQVYVTSELKIKLFCLFILSTIAWIFMGMENKSTYCPNIWNNSKRTKTSRNEVMEPTTSNKHSQPIVPKSCPQTGRFYQVYS